MLALYTTHVIGDIITVQVGDRVIYREDGFSPATSFESYFIGWSLDSEYRTLLSYGIPVLGPSMTVVSAAIQMDLTGLIPGYSSADTDETLTLFDYTDAGGGIDAYTDLGQGLAYGTGTFSSNSVGTIVSIPLNNDALSIINQNIALGGGFRVGATLTTLSRPLGSDEILRGPPDPRSLFGTALVLEIVPEPHTAILIAMGLITVALGASRRASRASRERPGSALE